ncbi:response regulator transcription factor [Fictibacillus fluitans]|uniref:Response regulator n=1 Tax=Fictibacillus fluitans TaxID=3058422 RepID=A0ABT8HQ83_9BACL|nr:response regulator [Fictibacillus sp. NE201]MDN4522927.1 response regulator [Fictibacillus sp. NE201]
MNIMVVDDEPLEREVLLDIVAKGDINLDRCFEAENGLSALEQMRNEEADIVIMDLKMPVMDGIHAAAEMKDLYPQVKIIILTAYNDFDYAVKSLKIGVEDFLLKPVSPKEILASLIKITEQMSPHPVNEVYKENPSDAIRSVTEYIHMNLDDKLSLKQLAHHVFLHPQYLSRLFKQETGKTVTEYITQKRIEKSRELLIQSQLSITEISQQCGFTDINYFSRVFSKLEGVPPKKYRAYHESMLQEKRNVLSYDKIM